MKTYTIDARFVDEIRSDTERFMRRAFPHCMRNVLLLLIVFICYLGAFVAIPITGFLPFNILKWFGVAPTSTIYWLSTGIILACTAVLVCALGLGIYRRLEQKRIDIDMIVVLAGSVTFFCLVSILASIWWTPLG